MQRPTLPYTKESSLLTGAERDFHAVLQSAVGDRWQVWSKVRLADLVRVDRQAGGRRFHLSRVAQKHVDFVLCDHETSAPLLVIELDDPSHERPDRQRRDELVDHVLASAELPILHVPWASYYSAEQLAFDIEDRIASGPISVTARDVPDKYYAPPRYQKTYPAPATRSNGRGNSGGRHTRRRRSRRGLTGELISLVLTLAFVAAFWSFITNPSEWVPHLTVSAPKLAITSTPATHLGAAPARASVTPHSGNAPQRVEATIDTANLNMRSGPGKDYQVVGTYPQGTHLQVIGKDASGGWLKLSAANGQIGWMSSTYVRVPSGSGTIPVVETPGGAHLP